MSQKMIRSFCHQIRLVRRIVVDFTVRRVLMEFFFIFLLVDVAGCKVKTGFNIMNFAPQNNLRITKQIEKDIGKEKICHLISYME